MLETIYEKEGLKLEWNHYSSVYVLSLGEESYQFKECSFPENVSELKSSRPNIKKDMDKNKIGDKLLEEMIQKTL